MAQQIASDTNVTLHMAAMRLVIVRDLLLVGAVAAAAAAAAADDDDDDGTVVFPVVGVSVFLSKSFGSRNNKASEHTTPR